jgi:hypothetical protein
MMIAPLRWQGTALNVLNPVFPGFVFVLHSAAMASRESRDDSDEPYSAHLPADQVCFTPPAHVGKCGALSIPRLGEGSNANPAPVKTINGRRQFLLLFAVTFSSQLNSIKTLGRESIAPPLSVWKNRCPAPSAPASAGGTDRDLAVPQFTQNCGAYNIIELHYKFKII